MKVRSALAALLVLLLPACSSAKLSDLDPEQPDLDVKREALVKLGHEAREDVDLRKPLYEKAKALATSHETTVSVRVVAIRVLAGLAKEGVEPEETARILGDCATTGRSDRDDRDFWCRIEAVVDLCELATLPEPAVRDKTIVPAIDASRSAVKADEPDRDVRIHAARELSVLAESPSPELAKALPNALDELVQGLSDETPDVREHATRALKAIAGGDHGPAKEDWERWLKNRREAGSGK